MTTTQAREAADVFAVSIGEDPAKVQLIKDQWASLIKECAHVTIHCTGWRAETILSLEDLGLYPKDDAERASLGRVLLLGRRLLLPRHVVAKRQSLENKFRAVTWRHSYDGKYWGRLVPRKQYLAWRTECEQVRAEYLAFVNDVAAHWSEHLAEVRADYVSLGRQNWRRLENEGRAPADVTSDAWVNNFVERCMAKVRSREYWLAEASMSWEVGYISLVDAQRDNSLALAEAIGDPMTKDIALNRSKTLNDGLFQFMADVRGQISTLVYNVCADVLAAIEANEGELPRNSSKQLRNLITQVSDLKFWDDDELEKQMAQVYEIVDTKPDWRDGAEITRQLKTIGQSAHKLLLALDRAPERRSRHLGMAEDPRGVTMLRRGDREMSEASDALSQDNAFQRQPRSVHLGEPVFGPTVLTRTGREAGVV